MNMDWVAELIDDDTKDILESITVHALDEERALMFARHEFTTWGIDKYFVYKGKTPIIRVYQHKRKR